MNNVISMQEYIHNSQHAQMGCGPMSCCELCSAMGYIGFGPDEAPEPVPAYNAKAVIALVVFTAVLLHWVFFAPQPAMRNSRPKEEK